LQLFRTDFHWSRIFGFLDVRNLVVVASVCKLFARLQEDDSIWCSLFPKLCSFRLDLPAKERVQRQILLTKTRYNYDFILNLSIKEEHECILDLSKKTITLLKKCSLRWLCEVVLGEPNIPNGSFIVYSYSPPHEKMHIPCVAIKSMRGTVSCITNLDWGPAIDTLKLLEHEGNPSQFHEFKLILSEDDPFGLNFLIYAGCERALRILKGTPQ
jgi:hypothetical protein